MLRAGLVNGMGTKFNPKGTSTRAQAATILMRLDELAKYYAAANLPICRYPSLDAFLDHYRKDIP
jgi:hypothetical protein